MRSSRIYQSTDAEDWSLTNADVPYAVLDIVLGKEETGGTLWSQWGLVTKSYFHNRTGLAAIELNLENVILEGVTYAESKFVAVGIIISDDGLTVERGLILFSNDGFVWKEASFSQVGIGSRVSLISVSYGNDRSRR